MLTKYTFFHSFHDALKGVDDATYGRCVRALSEFAFTGVEPQLTGADLMFFTLARPLIEVTLKRAEAGRLGGSQGAGISRNTGNQNATKTIANQKQNNSKTIGDKEEEKGIGVGEGEGNGIGIEEKGKKEKETKEGARRFSPPSVGDVEAYCVERRNGINPQAFIDFYASKGWRIGNSPMKDWKAAVRTWEQRRKQEQQANAPQSGGVRVETDKMGNRIAVYPDGFKAFLGVGEYIDRDGNRRYGTSKTPVPREASPRPGDGYTYSKGDNSWVTGV